MKKTLLSALLFLMPLFAAAAVVNDSIYVLNVDFESGKLPEGWTQEFVDSDIYGEHRWVIESAADAAYPSGAASGNYLLALRNNTTATIGYTTRLISPVMNLAIGKVFQPILVFSHAQQQRTGDFDQLKVYYRSGSDANWVRLDGKSGNPEFNTKIAQWKRDTINLTSQDENYQIMFEVTDRFGRGVVLDDIQVRPMPTCVDPYGFDISTLTTTAATVSWNASFDTDSFEVALSENYIPDTVEVDPEQLVWHGFLVDDEFAFSTAKQGIELTRNKTYYVYVRAYCQGAISEWTGTSFRTKNIANLPLTETFTNGKGWDYKTGTLNHINYWTFGTSIKREDGITMEYMPFVNTNTEPGTATAGYYAFDKNFCLAFTGARALGTAVPAGAYVYAATPELNVEKIQNVFVSFWGTAYQKVGDLYAGGIIVGVMTDPEDFTTFVPVDTCYITETSAFNKFGVSLANYKGEGKYVAFASDFKDKDNCFYMDEIVVKESTKPVWPSDIEISNVSVKGFELSLNSFGNAYNVIVTKRVPDPITGLTLLDPTTIDPSNYFVTLNKQTAQKLFVEMPITANAQLVEVYVQSVNQAGQGGEWALPVTTRLPMYLAKSDMPYKLDWENKTDTWTERMLHQYGNAGTTTAWPNDVISTTQYAPNAYGQNMQHASLIESAASQEGKSSTTSLILQKEYNEVTKGDPALYTYKHQYGDYIALPQVDNLNEVLLKFYMKRYSSSIDNSSKVAVGVMTDPYDIKTFETVAVFEATSATEYQPFSCTFESYKGEGKIIAIQAIDAENPVSAGALSSSGYAWNEWYSTAQYIDWIQFFPLGECNPIANPKVEATYESAKISWGANEMSAWNVYVVSEKGDTVLSTKVETNSVLVEGLKPHTTYKYIVAPLCDAALEMSDWLTFETECLPGELLPFVEDFENEDYVVGSTQYWIPYCWSSPRYSYSYQGKTTSYYPYISRSTTDNWGHNSHTMFSMYSNSGSTNQQQMWVALPKMAAAIDSLQIEFYVKGYSASQNSMLQVGVMTDPEDLSTFEVVDSINVIATAWKGAVVKFDQYKGQGKHIAIKRDYERDGFAQYYLDDITVDYIKDCDKLFALSTSSPAMDGATLSWNKTNADKYEVMITTKLINANAEDTTGLVVEVLQTDTNVYEYKNAELALNTNYYAYVRTVCGASATSWSDGAVFKTTCQPETPEEYGVMTFTDANAAGCWSTGVMNGATTSNLPKRAGSATGKFGWYFYMFNVASTDGAYAIMPPLKVDDITKYQITFDIASNSTTKTNINRMSVGIISNAGDLSTFAPLQVVNFPYATDSTGMLTVTIPFDQYDGDLVTGAMGNQVMFLSESGDSTNYAYIDNIRFEAIPTCAAPNNVWVDSVGTYGAQISWNGNGAAYELAITATKLAPNEEKAEVVKMITGIKENTVTVEGLEMLTDYYMYVRTICVEGDTTSTENISDWSNPRSFSTTCPEFYTLPFAQDFEESKNTGAAYKPDCWTYYYDNAGTITEGISASYPTIVAAANSHDSKYAMYLYSSNATKKIYTYAATPYIETNLSKTMVSFWYRANAWASTTPTRKLVVAVAEEVSTLDTLLATMTILDTIVQTNTSTASIAYEKYSCIINEKYQGNAHYVVLYGIEGNGTSGAGGMYVDDVEVTLVPTCFLPDNLSAQMYDTEAQLTWEQLLGNNTAWDVAYGPKGTDVSKMTILPATENKLTVTGLKAGTAYDFYVRANCGDGDLSDWRGPVTETTLYQVALKDAKWTFENGEPQKAQAPTGSYKAPLAWMVNNVHTGLATVGNAPYIAYNTKNSTTGLVSVRKAYSGDSVMYFYSGTTAGLDGYGPYAVLPVVSDEELTNLQIRFMARATYSDTPSKVDGRDSMMYTTYAYEGGSYARTVRVGTVTDPYDMSTFEELTAYVLPTTGTSTSKVDINKVPDPEGTNYWREIVVPFYGAKGKYIVIAGNGNYNVFFVDDLVIEKMDPNACMNVTKLALNEEALTDKHADFTWMSPKTNFQVTITAKDADKPYVVAMVDKPSFAIDTLQEQTTYIISIQAVCEGGLSKATTLEFTTPCTPTAEYEAQWGFTENLYQSGTSATYMLPECWDEGLAFGSGASYHPYAIINPNPAAASQCYSRGDTVGGRALQFYTTKSYYNAYAVLPELDFQLDSMVLHFWGRAARFNSSRATNNSNKNKLNTKNDAYARTLIIGTMTDAADFTTFMPLDTIKYDNVWTATTVYTYNDETGNNFWQEYALPLAKYAGKGRIAIVAPNPADFSTASAPTSYFYIDDMEIIKGDFCLPVSTFNVSEITAESAKIYWGEFVTKNTVEVLVATDESFEESTIVYHDTVVDVNSVVLTNLKSATAYYYKLKHICDAEAGDESDWTNSYSFLTSSKIRFNEDFNNLKTTLPAGWGRSMSAAAEDVFRGEAKLSEASATATYAWRTNNEAVYTYTTYNNATTSSTTSTSTQYNWLISPVIDLSKNVEDSLLLSFDVVLRSQAGGIPNDNTDREEEFMVIVSEDQGATWSKANATIWSTEGTGQYDFAELYTNAKWQTKYIDMSKYAGKSVKIAFYLGSLSTNKVGGSKNIIYLDNIQLNQYTLVVGTDAVCRWEDYAGYGFDIDADLLPAGENTFERFTPADKDGEKDVISQLTITVTDESVTTLEPETLCEGETYTQYNFNITATADGVYKQKLQNAEGCDSIVVLNINVNKKQYVDIEKTICQGSYYEFNGEKYYTNTNQTDTLTSVVTMCDSIVTLHLTVNEILRGQVEQVYLCPGMSYDFTDQLTGITEGGLYTDTIVNAAGCDSIATVNIVNVQEAYTFIRAAICKGEVYDEGLFGGLRTQGDYSTPKGEMGLKTVYGCDSVVTLHLLVAEPTEDMTYILTDTIASDALPYVLNGQEHLPVGTADGVYTMQVDLGCGPVRLVVTVGTTEGISSIYVNTLALTPNPATVGEPIQVLGTFDNPIIEVISATGAVAYKAQNVAKPILIPGMPVAGVYLVRVIDGDKIYQSKLMVK